MKNDLFGAWPPSPADRIMGMRVKLDRAQDLIDPCFENIAIIAQGKGPHAAQLCCENCWQHLGWLSKPAVDFLTETVRLFGVPDEPFLLTDATPDWGCALMKKSEALPSRFFRAADFGDREMELTIESVAMEKIANDEKKPVMRFKSITTGLVINSGNWDTMATAYGEESDEWVGKRVILHREETTMKGKPTLGMRIKVPETQASKPKLVASGGGKSKPAVAGAKRSTTDDLEDDIPF